MPRPLARPQMSLPPALEPRNYQHELFLKAANENVIAVLGTGKGKTLISVMLIRHVLDQEYATGRKRKIVFLVNQVHLVVQQSEVIRANSPARVGSYYGELGVDYWDMPTWSAEIEAHDVLVMTSQILLNLLMHAYTRIDQFALLILDEVHHTTGNSPYNRIMSDFYFDVEPTQRPKIFGMTASPSHSVKDIQDCCRLLERATDSVIYTSVDESAFFTPPKHRRIWFEPLPFYGIMGCELTESLRSRFGHDKEFDKFIKLVDKTRQELGSWCEEHIWHTLCLHVRAKFGSEAVLRLHFQSLNAPYMISILEHVEARPAPTKPDIDSPLVAPKVLRFIELLKVCARLPEFRCIVFVERRVTAVILCKLLEALDLKNIRPRYLVGHGRIDKVGQDLFSMDVEMQSKVIQEFRDGSTNLLLSTTVGEEGLDIPVCNIVIRTPIAYIQSRGRARSADAFLIFMQERGDPNHVKLLLSVKDFDTRLMEWCRTLPLERRLLLATDLIDDEDTDDQTYEGASEFVNPDTGARINLHSAVSLVNEYCQLLPSDQYCRLRCDWRISEISSGVYQCTLTLPNNAPFREMSGSLARAKTTAKKSTALNACVKLFELGGLNQHLRPVSVDDGEDVEPKADEFEGTWRAKRDYRRCEIWQTCTVDSDVGTSLWHATLLSFDGDEGISRRPIIMLSCDEVRCGLPIDLYTPQTVRCVPKALGRMSFSVDQLQLLRLNTLKMFSLIFCKDFTCSGPDVLLFGPCRQSENDIDWDAVRRFVDQPSKVLASDALRQGVDLTRAIVTTGAGQFYHVEGVESTTLNTGPGVPHSTKDEQTIATKALPRLLVRGAPRAFNFLHKTTAPRVRVESMLPHLCHVVSCSADTLVSFILIPALLTWVEATMIATTVKNTLSLQAHLKHVLEALLLPSANLGINYERLETLGDAFLKMATGIFGYLTRPNDHEGKLHNFCRTILENRRLYICAKKIDLPAFIIGGAFNRKRWLLPGHSFSDISNTVQSTTQRLADKQIADVVEALLGACVLENGVDAGLAAADSMKLGMTGVKSLGDFRALLEQPSTDEAFVFPATLAEVESIIGYSFQDTRYLVQAYTHASRIASQVGCYQRLEFLGDTLIDYFVINDMFTRYPEYSPGMLTRLKGACTSNEALSAACIDVGLHRFVLHESQSLLAAITDYDRLMKSLTADQTSPQYWFDVQEPKVLADVLEALVGAVFLDSDMNLDITEQVYTRVLGTFLHDNIDVNNLKMHAAFDLMWCFRTFKCRDYKLKVSQDDKNPMQYLGWVDIHGAQMGRVSAFSSKDAKKQAARVVIELLEAQPEQMATLCDCEKSFEED